MKVLEPDMLDLHHTDFDTGQELASALAKRVGEQLSAGIAARGEATIAVSGGSTPKAFFVALSKLAIDWPSVTLTLVDERMVPPEHERSNHRLASLNLLQNKAAEAKFVPLFSKDGDAEQVAQRASAKIDALMLPFDVVVLGMGTDGHTASFFPGGSTLSSVTDLDCAQSVMHIEAPGAGEPRLTLTLPRLVEARFLVLHIEGNEKKTVLEKALENGPDSEMPVRVVLRGAKTAVNIFWAP